MGTDEIQIESEEGAWKVCECDLATPKAAKVDYSAPIYIIDADDTGNLVTRCRWYDIVISTKYEVNSPPCVQISII